MTAAVLAAVLATAPLPAGVEGGRALTRDLYAGRSDALVARFSATLRTEVGGHDGLDAFRRRLAGELGAEERVLFERAIPLGNATVYLRRVRFSRRADPFEVEWTFDHRGTVVGLLVREQQRPAPTAFIDYRTKTRLRLPFEGPWFVYWGGRSVWENQHATTPDQRFACDFLVVRGGKVHDGDGTRNEQYHSFGQPVLAPGDGVVVTAANGVLDNPPGRMDEERPLGNHVVIDHGSGEYSFLAHLQRGSISIKSGDRVKAGQRIGRCGNSGRSTNAHLHYHLQTSPRFGWGRRESGLPAEFVDYVADGRPVLRGAPIRGQTVSPR